ncbi:hypothetical protein [Cohnella sp. GbtcB17]|uniref:hypothetical protein n=1 Tax=Cohnella sp. GbtcB17 TaxID=2824762 RepID=UPI001C2F115B|nr:hypothetical protein [Cohnella sp. GbtcB17]
MTSVISAVPVSADASRVVNFTIQGGTICSATNYTALFLNITNLGGAPASYTVYLYDANGNTVSPPGLTNLDDSYRPSTINPATSTTSLGKSTELYRVVYGGGNAACSLKPYYGKIVVEDGGPLIATGEIKGIIATVTPNVVWSDLPISINNGQSF